MAVARRRPVVEYFETFKASENAALAAGAYEWSQGNGENTPMSAGIVVGVPSGYSAELISMGLSMQTGTAVVIAVIGGVEYPGAAQVTVTSPALTALDIMATPTAVADGDTLNFKTRSASGTSGPNIVTMQVRFYK